LIPTVTAGLDPPAGRSPSAGEGPAVHLFYRKMDHRVTPLRGGPVMIPN